MNNQDQAAQVIYHLVRNHLDIENELSKVAAIRIAQILCKESLLASDPPQPFFEKGSGTNWEIPINDQGGGVATVRCLIGEVFIERHGHGFITSPAEAKQLAAAILAAANYQEEA